MSSLSAVDRSVAAHKNDRKSLCMFTFSDGRRCRTPRIGSHPHFCFYHAQKEARARAAESLGKDLAYFFSGDYLSACDLSTALARLIPAVLRGDVKPRAARTVAYLAQTLLQAIHISEQEYINAFSTDDWRKSIRNSVNGNRDYRFPPDPQPQQPASPQPQPQPKPQTQPPQPAPSPHTPMPPTSAEFVQHVVAGLQTGDFQASSEHQLRSRRGRSEPVRTGDAAPLGKGEASRPASPPKATPPSPSAPPTTSLIQSSTGAHHFPQQPSETHPPVTAAQSTARQEPGPTAGPQTGPSGLPVLAPLPRGIRERPHVLAPFNSFIINTYRNSPQLLILNHLHKQ